MQTGWWCHLAAFKTANDDFSCWGFANSAPAATGLKERQEVKLCSLKAFRHFFKGVELKERRTVVWHPNFQFCFKSLRLALRTFAQISNILSSLSVTTWMRHSMCSNRIVHGVTTNEFASWFGISFNIVLGGFSWLSPYQISAQYGIQWHLW